MGSQERHKVMDNMWRLKGVKRRLEMAVTAVKVLVCRFLLFSVLVSFSTVYMNSIRTNKITGKCYCMAMLSIIVQEHCKSVSI